jgi:hypothetical protein
MFVFEHTKWVTSQPSRALHIIIADDVVYIDTGHIRGIAQRSVLCGRTA